MEYKKNDRVTLTIEDMGSDGEGIGKVDGFTLFIKDAVIGDQVEAKIIKSKKHYAYARLEKVLQPSPFRVEPKCAYHRQCGGCQLQALSYSEQLHFKEQKIRNNLIRIGGFDAEYIDERMQPIVEEFKKAMEGTLEVVQVDIDQESALADFYTIEMYPTFILMRKGEQLWRQSGELPLERLEKAVKEFNS